MLLGIAVLSLYILLCSVMVLVGFRWFVDCFFSAVWIGLSELFCVG